MCKRRAFKPLGEAESFKVCLERTIQINHGLYYDIKQLVSMDTTVTVVYGSYTLEYNWVSLFTGLDHRTGLLDWTTELNYWTHFLPTK